MPTDLVVPTLGESITEAVLLRWSKNDGAAVAKDEPVAELETDKANVDLNAPAAGVLRHSATVGATVKVGEAVARIDDAGAAGAAPPAAAFQPAASNAAGSGKAPATAAVAASAPATAGSPSVKPEDLAPSVRRLVEENQLDAARIGGSGPSGRVTKEDVLKEIQGRSTAGATGDSNGAPKPATAAPPAAKPVIAPASMTTPPPLRPTTDTSADGFDAEGNKRVPMTKMRKRIAQTLVQAQHTAAILTTFNEVDLSQVMALRGKFKERFQEVHGIGLGFISFFARGVVLALREYPRVNAEIQGDDIVYRNYVHLGVAVSTERGLAVPILRHAESMGFAKIESEVKRLATAARDGKLGIPELSGGTFTITNGGVFGSLLSTPILLPPQSGILGMHAIQQRPIAVDGKVEIRPMMYVALSYDHRVVDGRESVSFLVRLKQYLEDPTRLMLEI